MSAFSKTLKQRFEESQMTVQEVANHTGLPEDTVQGAINGKLCSFGDFAKLMDYLAQKSFGGVQ